MKKIKNSFLSLLIISTLWSCSANEVAVEVELIPLPTEQPSSLPRLTRAPSGEVYLSWVEKSEDKSTTLKFSQLKEGAWTQPQIISSGKGWFVNWADFPALLVNGEQMAAHWLQKSADGTYDYDVRVTFSSNHGADWSPSVIPHNGQPPAEYGFVSMLPMEEQKTFITWLDGRNTKNEDPDNAMSLRSGIFNKEGTLETDWELDHRICDCCQTGAALTSNGPMVVYRDRSEREIRDIYSVRWVNGTWTAPEPVANDFWEIAGCPVNGPAIAANGDLVAVAWFTAKGGFPMVKLAFSTDAGASFGQPVTVSEGTTNGRVGLTLLEDKTVVVSWMDTKEETATIQAARYDQQGALLKSIQVAQTSAARASGFPVITSTGNRVYMAWTQVGEKNMVKTAALNF